MLINHLKLTELVKQICIKAGTLEQDAQQVASLLVEANLKGHDSHGVQMLPIYIYHVGQGSVKPQQHAIKVSENGSNLIVDGAAGFGQIVGPEAIEMGLENAAKNGVCVVALKNSYHLGRIGGMGEQCAAKGFISMHYVNVVGHPPHVTPFGGTQPRFGTNPYCCAIPVAGQDPIVLDMATSYIAHGKARVAHHRGTTVPDGSLLDHKGKETNDPKVLFEEPTGSLAHFGRHKGYGLALICELLGGALCGAFTMQPGNERKLTIVNNMLTIILDPDQFAAKDVLESEIKAMIEYVKSSPPAEGTEEVLIAGEPERIAMKQRMVEGIFVDDSTWSQIESTAKHIGIPEEEAKSIIAD